MNFLIRIFLGREEYIEKSGDLEEVYSCLIKEVGPFRAKFWLWTQALKMIPTIVLNSLYWRMTMFKNFWKISVRTMIKQKMYSLINILGLAIGLTCVFLIGLYIQYELSFDKYHENADDIYRIVMFQKGNKVMETEWFNSVPGGLKRAIKEEFPEVLKTTRATPRPGTVNHHGNLIIENNIRYADPEFLDIFSFPLLSGQKETALNEPFTILLTEDMARKYFGRVDPVGKVLNINKNDYRIAGVLKNIPKNSHFTFDFLASFKTLYQTSGQAKQLDGWSPSPWNIYLLAQKNVDFIKLGEKITALYNKSTGSDRGNKFGLQPLTRIHLHSKVFADAPNISDIRYVYLFSTIALLIMLIACLNYINLSTARSAKRLKEIGVRKIAGAQRTQLMKQFFTESIAFVLLAFVISLLFAYLIRPVFANFVERDLNFKALFNVWMILKLAGLLLIVTVLSGSYPALLLSNYKPIHIFKGGRQTGSRSFGFRSILVTIQLMISLVLIICSLVTSRQLHFIRDVNLGFHKEHIIHGVVRGGLGERFQAFKDEIKTNPSITDVYGLGGLPTMMNWNAYPDWEGKKEGDNLYFYFMAVDYDFIDFFGIEMIQGRNFSKDFGTDADEAWLLNETAVKSIGWDEPIGKRLGVSWINPRGRVIGVMKDYHFLPLHNKIEPAALCLVNPKRQGQTYALKVKSENISGTLDFLKKKYREFFPEQVFQYSFLDETVDRQYKSERKLSAIFVSFTLMAVFIGGLGLLGLVSYTTEQKTKEIGIRKVLGASVSKIVLMLSREMMRWEILSTTIAFPVAWWAMNKWLQNFAYRIKLGVEVFIASFLISSAIVLLTVGYHTIKAATSDPVKALRYE